MIHPHPTLHPSADVSTLLGFALVTMVVGTPFLFLRLRALIGRKPMPTQSMPSPVLFSRVTPQPSRPLAASLRARPRNTQRKHATVLGGAAFERAGQLAKRGPDPDGEDEQ